MTTKSLNQAFLRAFSKVEKVPSDLAGSEGASSADLPTSPPAKSSTVRDQASPSDEANGSGGTPRPVVDAPLPNDQETREELTETSELSELSESAELTGQTDRTAAGEVLRIDSGLPSPLSPRRLLSSPEGKDPAESEPRPTTPRPVPSPHFAPSRTSPHGPAAEVGPGTSDLVEPDLAEPDLAEPHTVESHTVESHTVESHTVESNRLETDSLESHVVEPERVEPNQPESDSLTNELGQIPEDSGNAVSPGPSPEVKAGDQAMESGDRATWIISDLGHHARLLETMPLLVIPTGGEQDFSWSSDEITIVDELPLCRQSGLPTSPLESNDQPNMVLDSGVAESSRDAATETETQTETETVAEVEVEAEARTGAETEAETEAGTEAEAELETQTTPTGEQPAEREADSEAEWNEGSAEPTLDCRQGDEFVGAWEVDHVGWTSVCQQLYDSETQPFAQAGQQLFSATAEGLRVLAITSAYRGEGRTTMSLLLARSAAAAGVRVAILDADLDNPQLALHARVQPASDWRRTLIDQSPLEEAAIHAVREQITLFPLEPQSRGEPLRLADPRVTKLIHDIAARFDLLIIDMGPIANDDRRLFAGGKVCPLDAAVVVRDLRYTTDEQTSGVVRRLMELGVEAVGIAENFIRETAHALPADHSVTSRSA
jgi:Mrp family chromosome partitioning ATPase